MLRFDSIKRIDSYTTYVYAVADNYDLTTSIYNRILLIYVTTVRDI